MKKYLVETYYTCTFKTVHSLSDLNDQELAKIDTRTDGDVEVIDVKLNNRKTKKIGNKYQKFIMEKIFKIISYYLLESLKLQFLLTLIQLATQFLTTITSLKLVALNLKMISA